MAAASIVEKIELFKSGGPALDDKRDKYSRPQVSYGLCVLLS
jgi:hypothetical protein